MCNAYSVFSSGGHFFESWLVDRVEDEQGRVLYDHTAQCVPVCSPAESDIVCRALKRANLEGTAVLPSYHKNIAAKTGTSVSGGWYASFDDMYRVLSWTENDFQPFGTVSFYSNKGVSARILADRIWDLLGRTKVGFSNLFGVFAGVESLLVKDLLWLETQFQQP
jgi:penicillin-binding protein